MRLSFTESHARIAGQIAARDAISAYVDRQALLDARRDAKGR